VAAVVAEGVHTTADLRADRHDPTAGTTTGFTDAVVGALQDESPGPAR
jgi:hypothetical protein